MILVISVISPKPKYYVIKQINKLKTGQNNVEQWNDVTASKDDTPGLSFKFQPLKTQGVTVKSKLKTQHH
jgi:hypothetical protein